MKPFLPALAFALATALAAPPVAHAQKKVSPQPAAPQPIAVVDQVVSTPIGDFTFTHLSLKPDAILPYLYRFNGVATSLAGHAWASVFFTATFSDAAGQAVGTEKLTYLKIGAGQSAP